MILKVVLRKKISPNVLKFQQEFWRKRIVIHVNNYPPERMVADAWGTMNMGETDVLEN